MSDLKDMFDKTFKESAGTPAVEHAKRRAKEKAAKKVKFQEEYFTVRLGKILRVLVKHNGAYSSFVDRVKKLSKEQYKSMVDKWSKAGQWVQEHEADDKFAAVIEKLAAQREAFQNEKAKK